MISRAPMRISFGGGNTDLEPFRSEFGGTTFGVAIKKYAKASPTYDDNFSPLMAAIKDKMAYNGHLGMEVDAKPMSGLGASGAIAVACIGATMPGKLSRKQIASLAYDIERNDLGITGGFQDQVFAAYGGMLYIEFNAESDYEVIRMPRSDFVDELEKRLLLVYVGDRNQSGSGVLEDIIRRDERNVLFDIKELATEERMAVSHKDLNLFAALLNQSWELKKELSPFVSNRKIDFINENLMNNGAIGFKLLGAGGGGYSMVLCEDVDKVSSCARAMSLDIENVEFDWDGIIIST